MATDYAYSISAGHSLVILLKDAFPINILSSLKRVPEIVTVYCATSNPLEKIFVDTVQGRTILGVDDGFRPKSIETDKDIGGYGPEGIVFNSSNKSIYIVSISINSILKYDEYANKILASLQPIVHSQFFKIINSTPVL